MTPGLPLTGEPGLGGEVCLGRIDPLLFLHSRPKVDFLLPFPYSTVAHKIR